MPRNTTKTPADNLMRLGLPITAVAGIVWAAAGIFYGAGQKVSTSEAGMHDLAQRMDAADQVRRDVRTRLDEDHDTITALKSSIASLEHNIDVLQRNQNNMPIELNVKDEKADKK